MYVAGFGSLGSGKTVKIKAERLEWDRKAKKYKSKDHAILKKKNNGKLKLINFIDDLEVTMFPDAYKLKIQIMISG